jgi:hypothetical protein
LATSFHSISRVLEGEDVGLDALADRGVLRVLEEAAVDERRARDHDAAVSSIAKKPVAAVVALGSSSGAKH